MNKKKIILAVLLVVAIIVVITCIVKLISHIKNNPDVSNAKKAAVVNENVAIYKKPKESKKIEDMSYGENVYILDTITKESKGATTEWYKVREVYEKKNKKGEVKKTYNKVGYIKKDDVKYFEFDSTSEYVLMSDVSKFDIIGERFKTVEEYEAFLLNSKINYAYIRMGGRGYGTEGNFYTDPNYKIYIDACNYLDIPYGLYYVDEATNDEELDEEVEYVKKFIASLDDSQKEMLRLPVCIDVEKYEKGINARTKDIWNERGELLQKLTDKFKDESIDTLIYANGNMASEYLDMVDTNFWIAYYDRKGKVPTTWVTDIDWGTNEENNDDNDDGSDEKSDEEILEDYENEENEENENDSDEEDNDEKFKYEHFTENEELMPKVIAWQFSDIGAKEDGIKLKVDLSKVKNDFFKKFAIKE